MTTNLKDIEFKEGAVQADFVSAVRSVSSVELVALETHEWGATVQWEQGGFRFTADVPWHNIKSLSQYEAV